MLGIIKGTLNGLAWCVSGGNWKPFKKGRGATVLPTNIFVAIPSLNAGYTRKQIIKEVKSILGKKMENVVFSMGEQHASWWLARTYGGGRYVDEYDHVLDSPESFVDFLMDKQHGNRYHTPIVFLVSDPAVADKLGNSEVLHIVCQDVTPSCYEVLRWEERDKAVGRVVAQLIAESEINGSCDCCGSSPLELDSDGDCRNCGDSVIEYDRMEELIDKVTAKAA